MSEQQGKVVTASYLLQAAAASKGKVLIYTVPAARVLKLKEIEVNFAYGTNFELRIKIEGVMRTIAPTQGFIAGDYGTIVLQCDEELRSGEEIYVRYENVNASTARSCWIIVTGELF